MTRVVSFTLANVYGITDEKMGFQNYEKIAVHKPLPCLRAQSITVFNLLLDCENADGGNKLSMACSVTKISNNDQQPT